MSMVVYFIYDEGFTYICDQAGKRLPIDHSLDNLEDMLHPLEFSGLTENYLLSFHLSTRFIPTSTAGYS